jgi:hypothetical protein
MPYMYECMPHFYIAHQILNNNEHVISTLFVDKHSELLIVLSSYTEYTINSLQKATALIRIIIL